jgi:hypothetical protein
VRNAIRAGQAGQIPGWRIVDEAAVFGTHENVARDVEVGATAVEESGTRLGTGPLDVLRIKYQRARARKHKRFESRLR